MEIKIITYFNIYMGRYLYKNQVYPKSYRSLAKLLSTLNILLSLFKIIFRVFVLFFMFFLILAAIST